MIVITEKSYGSVPSRLRWPCHDSRHRHAQVLPVAEAAALAAVAAGGAEQSDGDNDAGDQGHHTPHSGELVSLASNVQLEIQDEIW